VHCIIGIHHFAVGSDPAAPSLFIVNDNDKSSNWVPRALEDLDSSFLSISARADWITVLVLRRTHPIALVCENCFVGKKRE
jgi:hypothetical protein